MITPQYGHRALDCVVREFVRAQRARTEPYHLFFAVDDSEMLAGSRLHYREVYRV
jgi:hypothetical protein